MLKLNAMKYKVGSLVALRDRSGMFTVVNYDGSEHQLIVRSSVSGDIVRTTEENVAAASDDALNKIREEILADAPVFEDDNRPVSPYTDEEILYATGRQEIFDKLIAGVISLEETKTLLGLKTTMVRKLKNKYLIIGDWSVFVSGKPGPKKGGTKFPLEIEELIITVAASDYTGPGANEERVIDSIISLCGRKVAPSRSTLRRRLRAIHNEREQVKVKEGIEAARDKFGSYPFGMKANAPLEIVEADGSPLDMHVRCRQTGMLLGRPYLMLIKDKFSKAYLGFALYFGAPSRWTLAQALDMAIKPKDDLLRSLGLDDVYKWIQYGRMSLLLVDGGPDLNAKTVKAACESHDVQHARRKRKQSGGSIERGLGIINRYFIQTLEGAVPSSGKKPRGNKIEQSSIYYLDEVFKMIVIEICRRHEKTGSDGFTANQRFLNHYGEHNGEIRTPPRFEDPLSFIIGMYHEHHVKVRKNAILIQMALRYDPGPYFGKTGAHVRVKIDNSNIDRAWVMSDGQWKRIERLGPDLEELRPYQDGPISMLAWKAKLYGQPKPGELTADGERIHLSQREFKKKLEKEARERARNAANAEQSERFGPFSKAELGKVKSKEKNTSMVDAADVKPLKGIDL